LYSYNRERDVCVSSERSYRLKFIILQRVPSTASRLPHWHLTLTRIRYNRASQIRTDFYNITLKTRNFFVTELTNKNKTMEIFIIMSHKISDFM